MHRSTVRVDEEPVVRLRADGGADRAELRAIARVLRQLDGTAAPRLLADAEDRLDLEHVGGRRVDRVLVRTAPHAVALAATIAEAVAAVHALGVVGVELHPAHVHVRPDGSVVLTRWSSASLSTAADRRAADVVQLGGLIETIAAPLHRVGLERASARSDRGGIVVAVRAIADRAALASLERPIDASTIARALRDLDVSPRRRRIPAAVVGVVTAAAVVAGWTRPVPDDSSLVRADRPAVAPSPVGAPPTTPEPQAAGVAAPCGRVTAPPCRVAAGAVHGSDGHWVVGDADDDVLLGRWGCAPAPLVALLRRPEGQVFVFDEWARPGDDRTARALLADPAAIALRPIGPDDCPLLSVRLDDGTTRVVPVPTLEGIDQP